MDDVLHCGTSFFPIPLRAGEERGGKVRRVATRRPPDEAAPTGRIEKLRNIASVPEAHLSIQASDSKLFSYQCVYNIPSKTRVVYGK
jgi:hypothetical protein